MDKTPAGIPPNMTCAAARNRENTPHVRPSAGTTATSAFPTKISQSVSGVARSGSRVPCSFSPTIEYTASVTGIITGRMRKYISAVLNNAAWASGGKPWPCQTMNPAKPPMSNGRKTLP